MTTKILIVGGGITGAIIGKQLRSDIKNVNLTLWEKLNASGGRFNTVRCSETQEMSVDLGAQYITTSDENIKCNDRIYSELFSNNLITDMNLKVKGMKILSADKKNFIACFGMKSIVDHFLVEAKFDSTCYDETLIALRVNSSKWIAVTDKGKEELFDIVILTIPVPEILKLMGNNETLLNNNLLSNHLSVVKYTSRFALGLFFGEHVDTEWDAEYIYDDPVLRFMANDSWKTDSKNKFKSAVIHTTVQFGEKYNGHDLTEVKEIIMKRIEKVFEHWPKPLSTIVHHWKYSQVLEPYHSKPGSVVLNKKPLLVAGGDGFIGSVFDHCIFSAGTVCSEILNEISV